jgi:hypothetical protein
MDKMQNEQVVCWDSKSLETYISVRNHHITAYSHIFVHYTIAAIDQYFGY